MENSVGQLNVVTGAFGFSGKYIARRLLASGERVRTLTNHGGTSSLFEVAPLDFRRASEVVGVGLPPAKAAGIATMLTVAAAVVVDPAPRTERGS